MLSVDGRFVTPEGLSAEWYECKSPRPEGTLVLNNSLGATRAMWERTVPTLRRRFAVVTYDMRGHGDSSNIEGPENVESLAEDLRGLVDYLEKECVHVVGLSLGGMVAMQFAATYPNRVGKLGLLCTSANLGNRGMLVERADYVRRAGLGEVADGVVKRWYTPEFRSQNPERCCWAREMILATEPAAYASHLEAIGEMDLTPELRKIDAPALVLAGERDPSTPPRHAVKISRHLQHAQMRTISKVAHLANDEAPRLINEELNGFL